MKQRTKSIFLVLIMGMILLALTGCGDKKLVATKTMKEDDTGFNATETIEISFKKGKADEVVVTIEFDDEKWAEYFASYFKDELKDNEIEQDGGKVKLTMSPEELEDFEGLDGGDFTQKELKEALEGKDFEVK